jgi:hypothetical protein
MRARLAPLAPLAAALALALPPSTGAQATAPAFSGRYKLVLTFGPGCPAAVQVGPLSVLVDVAEAAVPAGSEVSGQSAATSEPPEDARFVLLRQGDKVHGAVGARDASYVGFRTLEGYRIWMQIVADGAVTTSAARATARGSAFGEIDLSLPGDADVDTIGVCKFALDHSWSLEPL